MISIYILIYLFAIGLGVVFPDPWTCVVFVVFAEDCAFAEARHNARFREKQQLGFHISHMGRH